MACQLGVLVSLLAALTVGAASGEKRVAAGDEAGQAGYLFSYFVGNGEDGLHLAWSRDGYKWEALNDGRSYLTPKVGQAKLMRDPCIVQGPDGVFHMVWTTGWKEDNIGYAHSQDLIHWSEQKEIPVMRHVEGVRNCWAPELAYDSRRREFIIFWASTVPGRFTETAGSSETDYNHRMYFTTTKDFGTFTPAEVFYDPGFNVIDATFLHANGRHYLIVKDETRTPPRKHLRIAVADDLRGPFTDLQPPFTRDWVEGPTALKVGEDYLVYYDAYRDHRYEAKRSRDLTAWQDVTDRISFPKGTRHGTALSVPLPVVEALRQASAGEDASAATPAAEASGEPVRLDEDANSYTLDNGLIRALISKRSGVVRSLRYQGLEMLAQDLGGANGGYWSSVGRVTPGSQNQAAIRIDPGSNGGARAEISSRLFNDPAAPDGNVDIDIRYALGRGEHWLYTYAVWSHKPGWPPLGVGEARYALKLNPQMFDYLTIDAGRRRVMPTGEDWDRGEPLNVKEARRMTTGVHKNHAEHKYGYSALFYEAPAYGWSSTRENVGLWVVNPSMEYIAGGPTKLELTGHLDVNPNGLPTLLNMWLGSHYGGSALALGQDEDWAKVIGPFLIYCNAAANHDLMWRDALARAASESVAWPYDWVVDPEYPRAGERSVVRGRMLLRDPYLAPSQASNLWVGLTAPDYPAPLLRREPVDRRGFGSRVDWQRDSKHYQFWVKADADGRFVIPKVRPGTYWLHAFADGVLGEFTRTNIVVGSNQPIALGDLEWTPARYGRPLWEIGIPDRTALEFRNGANAWQWGTYLKYQKEFPADVNFIIGQSDWRRDWNYVQPPRLLGGKLPMMSEADEDALPASSLWRTGVSNTIWSILFKGPAAVAGKATLRLAFCGTHNGCRVEVLVNGQSVGETGQLPATSAMQRDSARAYWVERPVSFHASLLRPGNNTIQLVSHASSWSQGVMYDYVRLELSETN